MRTLATATVLLVAVATAAGCAASANDKAPEVSSPATAAPLSTSSASVSTASTTVTNRDGLAVAIFGPIYTKWVEAGGEGGALDQPTGPEQPDPFGGKLQEFEGGSIALSARHGAHIVWGKIRDAWKAEGGAGGKLGYPVSDEIDDLANGRQSKFERGVIVYDFDTDKLTVLPN